MGEAHLEIRELARHYPSTGGGVREISLRLGRGEVLTVVGPSGCGKTTLLRLIAGFETPQHGEILLGGQPVACAGRGAPPELRRIGLVFQEGALFPHLSVEENIAFGLRSQQPLGSRLGARLNRLLPWRRGGGRPPWQERVEHLLHLVGLQAEGGRAAHELSGGQQQRAALARALAPGPQLLLLDEPFAALDANLRASLRQDVQALLRREQMTAIFVTHDQSEALALGDRMAVMQQGRLVQQGTPLHVLESPASLFVAEFFGHNHLPAVWREGALHTALGLLQPAPGHPPWREGERLRVLAPVHRFCLAGPGEGAPARVQKISWLAGAPRYTLLLESPGWEAGLSVQTIALGDTLRHAGERIRVRLTPGPHLFFE